MSKELIPFMSGEFGQLRVVKIAQELWFVAQDALYCLGYPRGSHSTILSKLNEDETMLKQIQQGTRSQNLVTESGLYKLIMRSDKPSARRFQDWVTRDVLPAIRKDGSYVMGEEKVRTGEMTEDELILRAMEAQQKKVARLTAERNEALAAKAEVDAVVSEHLLSLTVDEWAALNGQYLNRSEAGRLAYRAKVETHLMSQRVGKEPRKVRIANGDTINKYLNVYPKEALDSAAKSLGLPVQMRFKLEVLS